MSKENMLFMSRYNDVYGCLLTSHQSEMIRLYYDCDVSLFEISEQIGVSRQAVRDAIKRAEALLIGYEKSLGLVKKGVIITKLLDNIELALKDTKSSNTNDLLTQLREIVEGNNGII